MQTQDNAGNRSDWTTLFILRYDGTAPANPPYANPGCAAANNYWQNTCSDANFTWPAGSDGNGSGVRDYHFYWGTDPAGALTTYVTPRAYDPPAIPDGSSYFLRLATRDNVGNEQAPAPLFVLRYDATPPTFSTFAINGGAEETYQVTVRLDLVVTDSASGVSQMRFSNNDQDWSDWQPYATAAIWNIPALNRRTLTVYAQVRDRAGNVASASDDIFLNLYPPMPHSDNYRICADVVDSAGSHGIASTSYLLTTAIGQPWASGATPNGSPGFEEGSGFLNLITGCLPIVYTPTANFTITQWVVASGGNLRDSASYRLGDTTGEAAASKSKCLQQHELRPDQRLLGQHHRHGARASADGHRDPYAHPARPHALTDPYAHPTAGRIWPRDQQRRALHKSLRRHPDSLGPQRDPDAGE